MSYLHTDHIAAHTEARNRLNAAAIALREELTVLLTPYLGKKIRKVSGYGGWIAKLTPEIDRLMADFKDRHGVSFHFEFSIYRFWVEVKTMYYVDNGVCQYIKQTLSIGDYDNGDGTLKTLMSADDRAAGNPKTDWTASEIITLKARIASLKAELSDAESVWRSFV